MKVLMASDHAGFELKNLLKAEVQKAGHEVLDLGALEYDALDDYPDFAQRVGEAIGRGEAEKAVLICGSGVGASIAANKMPGVRAGLCHDSYSAHQGVEHDDMNVLVLGARIIGQALAPELVSAFLGAKFSHDPRHQRRLDKVLALEKA
jgi:ribose 5-phosphate isomerase B